MSKALKKPDHISQQDWDEAEIPEWTAEDFAKAVPFQEAHPEAFDAWKRKPGRPKADTPKVPMNFRFATDLVQSIKATGRGYNARVEKLLRDALSQGKL
jgi:uncharacterized protein (DUF4415 family)